MTKCKLKTATAKDAYNFYGHMPTNSFKGIVAIEGDKVIGIGGLFYTKAGVIVFSDMKPEMRQYKKVMVKGCRMIMDIVRKSETSVYAVANDKEPTAKDLLERLGFVGTGVRNELGETLVWRGE